MEPKIRDKIINAMLEMDLSSLTLYELNTYALLARCIGDGSDYVASASAALLSAIPGMAFCAPGASTEGGKHNAV